MRMLVDAAPRRGCGIREQRSSCSPTAHGHVTHYEPQRPDRFGREIDLVVDAGNALIDRKITEISSWRERPTDSVVQRYARQEAIRLATCEGS